MKNLFPEKRRIRTMEWELEVDGKRTVLRDHAQLEGLLLAPEVASARSLILERVRRKRVSRWETFVYRLLGLRAPESEMHGSLDISVSNGEAYAVFTRNEDDAGSIGTSGRPATGRVEFVALAGEKFSEPTAHCISRDEAISAMLAFMRAAKRPPSLKWIPVIAHGQ